MEYKNNGIILQFYMENLGADTFKVSGLAFYAKLGGTACEVKIIWMRCMVIMWKKTGSRARKMHMVYSVHKSLNHDIPQHFF